MYYGLSYRTIQLISLRDSQTVWFRHNMFSALEKNMTYGKVNLNGYEFEGPYNSTVSLQNRSGVYVITGQNRSEEEHKVIDVGVSEDIRTRIVNHDRKRSWKEQRY